MPNDGIDVDRMAERAQALGLVSPDPQGPDEDGDEIVVLIHISGGLVAGVGTMRRDLSRLRVIVADDDVLEDGDAERSHWTEAATPLDGWGRDDGDALVRAAGELPEAVRRELGLADPE